MAIAICLVNMPGATFPPVAAAWHLILDHVASRCGFGYLKTLTPKVLEFLAVIEAEICEHAVKRVRAEHERPQDVVGISQ